MFPEEYEKLVSSIEGSDEFKASIMEEINNQTVLSRAKKEKKMKFNRKAMTGMVAATGLAVAVAIGSSGMFTGPGSVPEAVADNNPVEESGQVMASAVVNIEGVIEEVSKDGKSFRIGDLWIDVTEETELGISGPTAAPKDEQFMANEFEVGNSIAGFTLDEARSGRVEAYAVYTNWNWENN